MASISTLADEQAAYALWGWTWTPDKETPYLHAELSGHRPFAIPAIGVHPDVENDDLQNSLWQWQRTGQAGYRERAEVWAQFYRDRYRQGIGPDGIAVTAGMPHYGDTYAYDRSAFGGDHTFGWGLIDYAALTGDTSYLDAARAIGSDVAAYWSTRRPGVAPLMDDPRRQARHLYLATRLAEATGEPLWRTLRDLLVQVVLQSPDWNSAYGTYFFAQVPTDNRLTPGAYASGVRLMSSFQTGILTNAMQAAYRATGEPLLRERLVSLARFVSRYAMEPVFQYAGYNFGVNITTGAGVWSHTWQKTPDQVIAISGEYTATLVNTLVYGYIYTGDATLLTQAQTFLNRGTKQFQTSPTQRVCSDTEVAYFLDTKFDTSFGLLYYWPNKGLLQYAHALFANGGRPTVEGGTPVLRGHLTLTVE